MVGEKSREMLELAVEGVEAIKDTAAFRVISDIPEYQDRGDEGSL
jgi:hypothetical protein